MKAEAAKERNDECDIEQSLKSDDELTARKLRAKLAGEFPNLPNVSLAAIKLCRKE